MAERLYSEQTSLDIEGNSEFVFQSDFYEIKFWKYNSIEHKNVVGYTDNFCITYVNSGNFLFDLFTRCYKLYTGYVLIDKPQYEFSLPPAAGESTIFRFYPQFFRQFFEEANLKSIWFFSNQNLFSLVLKSIPELDYIHHQVIKKQFCFQTLEMDSLVMEFLNYVIDIITNNPLRNNYDSLLKKYHSASIEKAKEYIYNNFSKDISLKEIATHACLSPFHFSRIFKQFTSFSPHQYLLNLRLKHAEMLLKSSVLPVSDIASVSGFKTQEHFATSFKQKFYKRPNEYRKLLLR